jgi:hypothetical protein
MRSHKAAERWIARYSPNGYLHLPITTGCIILDEGSSGSLPLRKGCFGSIAARSAIDLDRWRARGIY